MTRLNPARNGVTWNSVTDTRTRRMASAGAVRVGGAVLTAVGVLVGLRALGSTQFAQSVLTLSAGQLIAFPATAMERLLIRSVATGNKRRSLTIMHHGAQFAWALAIITGLVTSIAYVYLGKSQAFFIASTGATAICASTVTLRQALNRAVGDLNWGQIPNELFRPFVTLLSYPIAATFLPLDLQGATSTLLASAATITLIAFAPTHIPRAAAVVDATRVRSAALSLVVISAVAIGIERIFPLILGITAGPADVSAFAVALRISQLAIFGQGFALFFYSPAIARYLASTTLDLSSVRKISTRVRAISMATAIPAAAACIILPDYVAGFVGAGAGTSNAIRLTAIAVIAHTIAGTSQTILILGGEESSTARIYVIGYTAALAVFLLMTDRRADGAILAMGIAYSLWALFQAVAVNKKWGKILGIP